jgi:hypothetical protein
MTRKPPVQAQRWDLLPDMPPTPFLPVDPDARISLAHALRPDFVGIRPEDFADVSDEQIRLASAEKLSKSVVDVGRDKHGALGYVNPQNRRLVFVATTPHEFGILAGSVQMLGERAISRSENIRRTDSGLTRTDMAAARRAGVHSVEGRLGVIEKYVENELKPEMQLISRFLKESTHPMYSELPSEGAMRTQLASVLEVVFGNLLEAAGRTRQWNPDQRRRARRAVDASVVLDRGNNNHIENFKHLLELAETRDGYLLAIARTKMHQAQQSIRTNTTDASKY